MLHRKLAATFAALVLAAPAVAGPLVPSLADLQERVVEPVFAFAFLMIDTDSLGTWTADDLTRFAADWGHDSDFPLTELVTITRQEIPPPERPRRGSLVCTRRLVVRLREDRLEFPMPYSILGYHPGSLTFAGPLVFDEWHLGERLLRVREDEQVRDVTTSGLVVLQMTAGFIVLDVDGWIDRILGKAADDAWTLGFAVGWADGELIGVGNSVGRQGRRIFGELDFETGEIASHGQPTARALAHETRRWMTPMPGTGPQPWEGY